VQTEPIPCPWCGRGGWLMELVEPADAELD
jgi:hypothetical protein